jgi:hypothetical protein
LKYKDMAVKQAMSHILQDDEANAIITKAESVGPEEAALDAVVPLLQSIYDSAAEAGVQIEMLTLLVAGMEIIGALAEMMAAAGLIPKDEKAVADFAVKVSKMAVDEHNQRVQGEQNAPPPGAPPAGGMVGAPQ